jgi:uncharacterized membrane protein
MIVMKFISKVFLTGLFTALPVLATIYLLVWLFTTAESFMVSPLQMVLPAGTYVAWDGSRRWVRRCIFNWDIDACIRYPKYL